VGDPAESETIIRSPKGAPPFADGLGLADGGIGKLKRLPNLAAGGEYGRRLKSRSGRGSRTAGLAFVAAMALTLCLPFNHAVYGLGDEGILLRGGAEMLAGQKLYTEFFEFYPPGGLLITQAWLLVFGHSFAAARALAIASIVGASCFAYLACAVASESVLLPAGLVGTWLVASQGRWTIVDHHWFTTCFSMLAAWLSFTGVREPEPRPRTAFIAGLASGAAAMVTPTRGALATLAAIGSFVDFRDRKVQLGACIAGCAVVPLLCLAYIVANGELAAAYDDIIRFPATSYSGIQGVKFAAEAAGPTLALALLFPLAPILPLIVVAKYGRGVLKDRLFRSCLLFATAGFIGAFPRPDIVHIAFAAPLALPLLAYCAGQITKDWNARFVYATGAIALVLCLPAAMSYLHDARTAWMTPTSATAAGPISFMGDPDAPAVFAWIDKTPRADKVLFYPYMPLAPFIAQRRHVSRYDMFVPEYTPANQYADACASANARATWLVLDRAGMDPATIKAVFPAVRNPNPPEKMAFERSIESDFGLVARLGRYEIRKRVTPSPARPCGA
jgi:hypothetical protein